jgi:hypothetical protein
MDDVAEPTFVAALPGWDVLTRTGHDTYDATPVVAWACLRSDEFVRAFPVTAALAWSLNDDRAVCAPDGRVIDGEAEWPTIDAWLAPATNQETFAHRTPSGPVLALDAFRGKFQRGE